MSQFCAARCAIQERRRGDGFRWREKASDTSRFGRASRSFPKRVDGPSQVPTRNLPLLVIGVLARENVDFPQLGERESLRTIHKITEFFLGQVRNEFAEVRRAKSAIRDWEFHDAIEPSGSPENSGVKSRGIVGDRYDDDAFLCSEAVQAIEKMRQTHSCWRELGRRLREGTVNVLEHNYGRSVARSDLEHSLEMIVVRLVTKQGNRVAV